MKEININIEGYNVNGICVGCLNYNRPMFNHDDVKECFRLLGNIDVPDGLEIQVCWECLAYVRSAIRFKKQILKSFEFLMEYSQEHTFLDSPNDFIREASTRLVITKLRTCICAPKLEPLDIIKDEIEETELHTQEEVLDESVFSDAPPDDGNSCEAPPDDGNSCDAPPDDGNSCEAPPDDGNSCEAPPDDGNSSDAPPDDGNSCEAPPDDGNSCDAPPDDGNSCDAPPDDGNSCDEDDHVSELEVKQDGRKNNKIKEDKQEEEITTVPKQVYISVAREKHKMRNLSEELVELFTMSIQDMWTVRKEDQNSIEFLKLKHRCDRCLIEFNTERIKQRHFKAKHIPKGPDCFLCSICNVYLASKDQRKVHESTHQLGFKCRRCGFLTALKRRMLGHLASHAKADAHTCWTCGYSFDTKDMLTYHSAKCERERPQCDCCGKVFANKLTLIQHFKSILKSSQSEPVIDKRKNNMLVQCKFCKKLYRSRKSYKSHVAIHNGVSYPCHICGKMFQWKRNLARHTRNHIEKESGAKHECMECGKTFASRECLNQHMTFSKRHVAEDKFRKYICDYCGRRFALKWSLSDHISWDHLKLIKYQCSICSEAFKTARLLAAHVSNVHEDKKEEEEGQHLCEICGKSFKTVTRLKCHVSLCHTNRKTIKRNYKCKICDAAFSWPSTMYKHMKKMHASEKKDREQSPRRVKKKVELHKDSLDQTKVLYYQQSVGGKLSVLSIQPMDVAQEIIYP